MKATQPKPNSFLWPIVQLPGLEAVSNGFIRIFTGNNDYEGNNEWGNYLYLLFNSRELSDEFKDRVLAHPQYHDVYDPEENQVIFILKLTDSQKETILKPFLHGQYSKIDRDYVKANFRKYGADGRSLSYNGRILHRDPVLRQQWEEILNVNLPEESEVWSKPEKEEDIFKYRDNVQEA